MTKLLALAALIAALVLPAAAQQAAAPKDLQDAQVQLKAALAQAKQERAEAAKAVAAAAPKGAQLSCHNKKRTAEGLSGTLELGSMTLETTRSAKSKAVKSTDESDVVDGRCGKLVSPLSESLTFEVTPTGYWGQDFLQIPKSAASADGKPFEAQLHTCQYDGDWHNDSDDVLVCTLAK